MDSIKNCPNCNAPIHGDICEYCGSVINTKKEGGDDELEKIFIYADNEMVLELERHAYIQAQISQAEQFRRITNSMQCPTYNPINYSMENANVWNQDKTHYYEVKKDENVTDDDSWSSPDSAQMMFCASWLLMIFLGLSLWITNKWRIVFDINPILLVFMPCYAIIGMGYAVIFHSSDFNWKHFWNTIDISFTVAFWIGLIWFDALSFKEFGPIILMAYEILMPIARLSCWMVG